jgi:methylenetetrahydrofolate dehydrogenase (NADP+)/methenyltetrahydrofolate cyclohydrolase
MTVEIAEQRRAEADTVPAEGAESQPMARILHGAPIAAEIRAGLTQTLNRLREATPTLPGVSVVVVGDDAASAVYAGRILTNAERLGLPGRRVTLPGESTTRAIADAVARESADPSVAGIILQLPLPAHADLSIVREALDPAKDIDGINPRTAGLLELGADSFYPSCAEAAVVILKRSGIDIRGRRAVVIGRSNVVGKPAALLLLREHATVVVCHRQTRDLAAETRRADLVIVAAGSPGLVTGELIRPGAVVVDCGINVVDGAIVGDVDAASVMPVAEALTPVPGGVGPVTNALLMEHLVRAVEYAQTTQRP